MGTIFHLLLLLCSCSSLISNAYYITTPKATLSARARTRQHIQQKHQNIQQQQHKDDAEIDKEIYNLALPAVAGLVIDPLMSIIDTGYVSRLGLSSIAAMGPCTSIFHFAFAIPRALSLSTVTLVASSLAMQNSTVKTTAYYDDAGEIAKVSILLAVVLGLVTTVALTKFGPRCLSAIGVDAASSLGVLALPYLQLRGIAAVAVTVLASLEGISRGHGDTFAPFLSSLVCGVANFCLDPLLMFGMGMKLGGAALATSIAQFIGTLYLFMGVWKNRLKMLSIPSKSNTRGVKEFARTAGTILAANSAVLMRTMSLLGCWAVGTSVW
jgi:Na+-driven multidrug efflux pump